MAEGRIGSAWSKDLGRQPAERHGAQSGDSSQDDAHRKGLQSLKRQRRADRSNAFARRQSASLAAEVFTATPGPRLVLERTKPNAQSKANKRAQVQGRSEGKDDQNGQRPGRDVTLSASSTGDLKANFRNPWQGRVIRRFGGQDASAPVSMTIPGNNRQLVSQPGSAIRLEPPNITPDGHPRTVSSGRTNADPRCSEPRGRTPKGDQQGLVGVETAT